MTKGRKGSPRVDHLDALFAAGDHGAARAAAVALLADAGSTDAECDAARDLLARLAPDRGAVVAGIVGLVASVVISVWLLAS